MMLDVSTSDLKHSITTALFFPKGQWKNREGLGSYIVYGSKWMLEGYGANIQIIMYELSSKVPV